MPKPHTLLNSCAWQEVAQGSWMAAGGPVLTKSTDKGGSGSWPSWSEGWLFVGTGRAGPWVALGWSGLLDLSSCSLPGLGGSSRVCPLPDNSLGLSVCVCCPLMFEKNPRALLSQETPHGGRRKVVNQLTVMTLLSISLDISSWQARKKFFLINF